MRPPASPCPNYAREPDDARHRASGHRRLPPRAYGGLCRRPAGGTIPSWGIVGASLRRPDTRNALDPQDGLYTVAVRDASGTQPRVVGAILEVLDANDRARAACSR
jgi:hypothetical protein